MFSFLNVELTSRCNKSCPMCGRRKMEREYPNLCDWGDMPYEMVQQISRETPKGCVVQFHNNGEPLLYRDLGMALVAFKGNIRCFNTNGKLLLDRAEEIIGNLETLTVSVVEGDEEQEEQYETVRMFLERKADRLPSMVYRLLGRVDNREAWEKLPGRVASRVFHSPDGSREYRKTPTIPEIGICLDLLTHLAIDRYGNISLCVRFDPKGELRLGNIKDITLKEAWESEKRRWYVERHVAQDRGSLPGCRQCEYWGVPRGE